MKDEMIPEDQHKIHIQVDGKDISGEEAQRFYDSVPPALRPKPHSMSIEPNGLALVGEQSPCDTQFAGFAKLLTDELIKYLTSRGGLTLDEIEQEWRKITARHAYDLVRHTLEACDEQHREYGMLPEMDIQTIPDMTEWPGEMK